MRDNRFNKNSKNNKKFKSREFDKNDRSDFRGRKNEYRSNDFKKKEYKKDNRRFEEKEYNKNEYRRDNRKVENKKDEEKLYEDIVEGRNPVLELLESGKDINKIFIQAGEKNGSITKIIAKAREKRIVMVEVQKSKLDEMSETQNHQGVIAIVPPFQYCDVYDILEVAKKKNQKPFILILDGIEDPHNLGSIIRTAETSGVHGIIIPKRRAAAVNATVAKTSAGAVEYVKIARVSNINETIKYLKDNDVWIYGTDGEAKQVYYKQDFRDGIALVIGSEGYGMSDLVKKNCDGLVKIPMMGKINSLNASVSAGIVMYEVVKQRI